MHTWLQIGQGLRERERERERLLADLILDVVYFLVMLGLGVLGCFHLQSPKKSMSSIYASSAASVDTSLDVCSNSELRKK